MCPARRESVVLGGHDHLRAHRPDTPKEALGPRRETRGYRVLVRRRKPQTNARAACRPIATCRLRALKVADGGTFRLAAIRRWAATHLGRLCSVQYKEDRIGRGVAHECMRRLSLQGGGGCEKC